MTQTHNHLDWRRYRSWRPLAAISAAAAVATLISGPASIRAASGCPFSNRPNEIVAAGGSPQTAQLGKPFETNLQVALANTNGCPLTGQLGGYSMDFDAPGSGASGTFSSTGTNRVTVGTNSQGVATAPTFTANDTAGSYTVDVSSDFGSVELYLSNSASGVVARIAATGSTSQQTTVNSQYPQPLQARVLDPNGQPVQGVSVTFAIGAGAYGASATFLGGGSSATKQTDSNGLAVSPPFVANSAPGRFTAAATAADISAVAGYSLDNHAAANSLTAADDPAETATVTTRYQQPLRARLLDPSGQPIEGATITFTLTTAASGAGASFLTGGSQATALTDENGEATSPPLIANSTPGRFTATADSTGLSQPLAYDLRNLPAAVHADPVTRAATVARRYRSRLSVRVTGRRGQPVEGVTVTFAVNAGPSGASASFLGGTTQATATTDASGRATAPPLVANTVAGAFTATASAANRTGSTVSYPLLNIAGEPAAISAGPASGETTAVGNRFPVPLAVTVTDKYGNPIGGAAVTFSAPRHGASGQFTIRDRRPKHRHHPTGKGQLAHLSRTARVETDQNGAAVAPPFTANQTAGGYIVTATVNGSAKTAAFPLVNDNAQAG